MARLALALALLLQVQAVAARRAEHTPAAIRDAARLWARAQSLRELQVPLLEQRARRAVAGALGELERSGVRVNRATPMVYDSSRELETLREAAKLLRGSPPASSAYALRREVLFRVRELQKTVYGMPRAMYAYTDASKGSVELAINLDNPFYGKPEKLVPLLAHEQRHIRDANRALRLERLLANEKNLDPRQQKRLEETAQRLWDRPRAEARAFEAQARALAATERPLGIWWRAPSGGPMDQAYPPATLNRALLRGYFQGLGAKLAPELRGASNRKRELARAYLAGYRAALEAQASAYVAVVRKDAGRDPAVLERYNATKAKILAKLERPSQRLTTKRAYLAGQGDALVGNAPIPRVRELVAR